MKETENDLKEIENELDIMLSELERAINMLETTKDVYDTAVEIGYFFVQQDMHIRILENKIADRAARKKLKLLAKLMKRSKTRAFSNTPLIEYMYNQYKSGKMTYKEVEKNVENDKTTL